MTFFPTADGGLSLLAGTAATCALVAIAGAASKQFSGAGLLAATAMGGVFAWAGGWSGVALFFCLFTMTAWATAHRRDEKPADPADGGHGPRGAAQVLAKTCLAALLAVPALLDPNALAFTAVAALPVAVAVADTWAGELGMVYGLAPKMLLSRAPVSPGRSGGVTAAGTIAGILGAASVGLAACVLVLADSWLRRPESPLPFGDGVATAVAATLAGSLGSLFDSALGETAQSRWRCAVCNRTVEASVHCDRPAHHASGLPWLSNAGVNLCASAAGTAAGLVALLALR